MSESDDVPGLSLAFFEGDGLSTGPGVLVALTTLGFSGSSAHREQSADAMFEYNDQQREIQM